MGDERLVLQYAAMIYVFHGATAARSLPSSTGWPGLLCLCVNGTYMGFLDDYMW